MKKLKLLYILNLASRVNNFSYASMIAARELGVDFHVASCFSYPDEASRLADEEKYGIRIHHIPFVRNPFHPGNLKAYRVLRTLMKAEGYDLIHTNTPVGGLLGRIAAWRLGMQPVIYQAHGFHFFKGSSFLSWLLYYPAEKLLARLSDVLITIATEDQALAKAKMHPRGGGPVLLVPGVGVRVAAYQGEQIDRTVKRRELHIPEDAPLLLSVGELNQNKNQSVILRAMPELPGVHYALAGVGPEEQRLRDQARELGILERVHFLGYRHDLREIYQVADIFCHPSWREGISVAILEAMASGLPVVASDIRGNRDLLVEGQGGFLVTPSDANGFERSIRALLEDKGIEMSMGDHNRSYAQRFDHGVIIQRMKDVYRDLLSLPEAESERTGGRS